MKELHFLSIDSTAVSEENAHKLWQELKAQIERYDGEIYMTSIADRQMKMGFYIDKAHLDHILGYAASFKCVRIYI